MSSSSRKVSNVFKIFQYLYDYQTSDDVNSLISIPDTLYFENSVPLELYYMDNILQANKNPDDLCNTDFLYELFSHESDLFYCKMILCDPNDNYEVTYFSSKEFGSFLSKFFRPQKKTKNYGIIQVYRYTLEPFRNSLIKVDYTKYIVLVERKEHKELFKSKHKLSSKYLFSNLDIFDSKVYNSRNVFCCPKLKNKVNVTVNEIKKRIKNTKKIKMFFKMEKGKVIFLYCTEIRTNKRKLEIKKKKLLVRKKLRSCNNCGKKISKVFRISLKNLLLFYQQNSKNSSIPKGFLHIFEKNDLKLTKNIYNELLSNKIFLTTKVLVCQDCFLNLMGKSKSNIFSHKRNGNAICVKGDLKNKMELVIKALTS